MSDLDVQIREYIDAVSRPLTIDDVEVPMGDGHVRPLKPLPPRRGVRRRWGVAAAGAAVVFVVLAPVLLLLGGSESDVGGTEPEKATTGPSTTALQVPASIAPLWSRVPHDEGVFGDKVPFTGGMRDVVVGGPGLVAVGRTTLRRSRRQPGWGCSC